MKHGEAFNFGGWGHIQNANTVTANESKVRDRTVGFFGSLSLDWKSMLFLNATGRKCCYHQCQEVNRTFFLSISFIGFFVASELEAMKNIDWISFTKVRLSYAEVGQAWFLLKELLHTKPNYGGGFWSGVPISYPLNEIAILISQTVHNMIPTLKPQNTNHEVGGN